MRLASRRNTLATSVDREKAWGQGDYFNLDRGNSGTMVLYVWQQSREKQWARQSPAHATTQTHIK